MAAINFYIDTGDDFNIELGGGSGLGFYGSSFGASVDVGSYQDSTFVTNQNGVTQGPQCNNTKWVSATGVIVNGVGPITLLQLPNYLATMKISFTHDAAVQVQNAKLRIYDRTNINLGASGVTTKVAEIVHPYVEQDATLGSGDASWITPAGSSVMVDLSNSPGESGLYAPGGASDHSSLRHDHYIAISASPDSIGSKTLYSLFAQLEYL